jgi:exosome complex component RRP4
VYEIVFFRYSGEIGDVIVGRIIELGQKRWKVDTKSKLESVLMLSSVNLPGGELVNETF